MTPGVPAGQRGGDRQGDGRRTGLQEAALPELQESHHGRMDIRPRISCPQGDSEGTLSQGFFARCQKKEVGRLVRSQGVSILLGLRSAVLPPDQEPRRC